MRGRSTTLLTALALCSPLTLGSTRHTELEDVVVTAQYRAQSAQATPISLFTLNAEALEKQRIHGITGLNGLVPNLNIDSFPSNNQALRLFIRGVGLTDTQLTQDAAVGVYLNGAYIARSTGLAFDIADLERIEVLRGPQGTLYGRNTTGGAIRLITQKPSVEALSFEQTLSTGNQSLFSSKSSLNLPFGDQYAARLAYFYEDVDGFVNNNGPGGSFGDRKSNGLRLDLRAQPSDRLTLDYGYDWSDIKYYNYTAQAVTPRGADGGLLGIVGTIASQYVNYSANKFNTLSTSVPLLPTDTTIDGHTLNVEWIASDTLTLKSITAWRELKDKHYLDFSSGAAEGFRIDFNEAVIGADAGSARLNLPAVRPDLDQEQFSQEFQLLGSVNHAVDYIVGMYYFHEKADEDARQLHHIFSAYPLDNGTILNVGSEYNKIENDSLALFAQLTWTPNSFDERLSFTLGWRYSKDSRKAKREVEDAVLLDRNDSVGNVIPTTYFAANPDNDFDDNAFAFTAEYALADTVNVYGKYSEAYKSGGFNIRDPDEEAFSKGFDEEKLRAVELGLKGEMLDRLLRLNAAVFYQRFDDFQYNLQIPGTISGTRVFNIDEGEMSGVELDLTVVPAAGLILQLNYAYLDSELDDVNSPLTGERQSYSFTNAPEHTYSLVVDYTWPATPFGTLNINTSYSYVDERQAKIENLHRDDYALLNARLSLSDIEGLGGQWTIAAWGKNLNDSDYEAFTLDNLPQASRAVIWGDGMSYGLDITYRYF